MKKLIFLLLLAQTISFLYADSACMGHRRYQGTEGTLSDPADKNAWRWGVKSPAKIRCDCPCMQYKQLANHKCLMCQHIRIPENLKISGDSQLDATPTKVTVTRIAHKKQTHAERKAAHKKAKAKRAADKQVKKAKQKLIAVSDE